MGISKNIIICSDGTGNTTNKGRGTNVFRVFESVDTNGHRDDATLCRQIAFYDDGVGTNKSAYLRIFTGATGAGVARNVRQLYRHLCRSYRPGDRIYLFGFSRGAYTVRTLAGIIMRCGIADVSPESAEEKADKRRRPKLLRGAKPGDALWLRWVSWCAWRMYRREFKSALGHVLHLLASIAWKGDAESFRRRYAVSRGDSEPQEQIQFMGVWDTVGAVGLPWDRITAVVNVIFYRFSFPNLYLNARVQKACQALAIDEERASFDPELWEEAREGDPDYNVCSLASATPPDEPRIEQVWFPGVHSDVGGGYVRPGLSYNALHWMVGKATAAGLRFNASAVANASDQRNVFDKLHDSRRGLGVFYRYRPRNIERLTRDHEAVARIHDSALERVAERVNDYAPSPLPREAIVVQTGDVSSKAVEKAERRFRTAKVSPFRPAWLLARKATHGLLLLVVAAAVYMLYARGGPDGLIDVVARTATSPLETLMAVWNGICREDGFGPIRSVLAMLAGVGGFSAVVRSRISHMNAAYWTRDKSHTR